jgi:hypothetical protein
MMRTAAVTGRTDTVDASLFGGRQGGRWAEQTSGAAFPAAAQHPRRAAPAAPSQPPRDPAETLRDLTELHRRGVVTDDEFEDLRAQQGV